jgi:hypothetical protein
MNGFSCSVCFDPDKFITMIQGTIICKQCLERAVNEHKLKNVDLEKVLDKIKEDRDIYD